MYREQNSNKPGKTGLKTHTHRTDRIEETESQFKKRCQLKMTDPISKAFHTECTFRSGNEGEEDFRRG